MTHETARWEVLTREAQTALCREFMAHVEGWKLYEDWIESRQMDYSDQALRGYCESLYTFWEFISHE